MSRDQVEVILITAGLSLAVGAVCALLSWRLRRASILWASGLVAGPSAGSLRGGGTAQAGDVPLLHDLEVVLLVASSRDSCLWGSRCGSPSVSSARPGACVTARTG